MEEEEDREEDEVEEEDMEEDAGTWRMVSNAVVDEDGEVEAAQLFPEGFCKSNGSFKKKCSMQYM